MTNLYSLGTRTAAAIAIAIALPLLSAPAGANDMYGGYTNGMHPTATNSKQYYDRWANAEPPDCVPQSMMNRAAINGDVMRTALQQCVKDQNEMQASADTARAFENGTGAVAAAAQKVANATDLTGQALDAAKDVADMGKDIADGRAKKLAKLGDTAGAKDWANKKNKCDAFIKGAGKAANKLNVAHTTAQVVQTICSMGQAGLGKWADNIELKVEKIGGACLELQQHWQRWEAILDNGKAQRKSGAC